MREDELEITLQVVSTIRAYYGNKLPFVERSLEPSLKALQRVEVVSGLYHFETLTLLHTYAFQYNHDEPQRNSSKAALQSRRRFVNAPNYCGGGGGRAAKGKPFFAEYDTEKERFHFQINCQYLTRPPDQNNHDSA